MALPQKDYYSLCDISNRWGVSPQDTRYYVEHGLLEVQTWLPEIIVKILRHKRTEDGEIAPVPIGVSDFKGYAVIAPDDLREIFRHNSYAITRFKNPCTGDLIKMFDPRVPLAIKTEDLVIAKCERDRFEKEYSVAILPETSADTGSFSPSFPGRRSVMHKIEKEFDRRLAAGKTQRSLRQEALELESWAIGNIEAQTPTYKTIMNALRPKYHQHTQNKLLIRDEQPAAAAI